MEFSYRFIFHLNNENQDTVLDLNNTSLVFSFNIHGETEERNKFSSLHLKNNNSLNDFSFQDLINILDKLTIQDTVSFYVIKNGNENIIFKDYPFERYSLSYTNEPIIDRENLQKNENENDNLITESLFIYLS